MALADAAIIGFAEAKTVQRSERSVWEIAAELLEALLDRSGVEKSEIDGLVLPLSASGGAQSTFWTQATADYLGLELDWCECVDIGGSSPVGAVARAAAALDAGLCTTVLALNVDTPASVPPSEGLAAHAFNEEFTAPYGLLTPPTMFGLLSRRYDARYGLDELALAKLAVTQRLHAGLNPNACEKLRGSISIEDYLGSRVIADPVRLLDCVMLCDGGSGLLITSVQTARDRGISPFVVPVGYGERSNYRASESIVDSLESGHAAAGARAFSQAGLTPADIESFHPYDDFILAILLQLETLGFCGPGEGAAFIHGTDMTYQGELPLNTGGGQISAGQVGAGGGGVNLTEAVRQLMGEGGARQIERHNNALVTGIGWIPYIRNWFTSTALVLAVDG